nr:mucin-2-like [Aedes albopictus]
MDSSTKEDTEPQGQAARGASGKIAAFILSQLVLVISVVFANPEIATPTNGFNGYNYPKPSIPFNPGYAYPTPSCPLTLPSTSYVTVPVTETSILLTTLPPVTVTLPRLTEYFTETQHRISTTTFINYLTATTTEFQIQPTTVTAYITSTYCAPKTYLPPAAPQNTYLPAVTTPPPPPPPPQNTYLPANPPQRYFNVENTTPNSFLHSFGFAQAGPIKRMANDIDGSSLEFDDEYTRQRQTLEPSQANFAEPPTQQQQLPAINIIYFNGGETNPNNGNSTAAAAGPPTDLMNWLLCRFNLANKTCIN